MKCTKKRDARAELLFCLFNQLLFWRSRCRRRRGISKSLVSCSALFKAFLDLTECKQGIWFVESEKFLYEESAILGFWIQKYSTRIRNRTKSQLETRIQVPLTKTGIQYLESRIPGVESRMQDCLRFPYCGAINFINKKRGTIAIKEHKIWKPNEKGKICERSWTECNRMVKTIMRKCIFACVDKTLLLVHPRNCRLIPVDYFLVSCGS